MAKSHDTNRQYLLFNPVFSKRGNIWINSTNETNAISIPSNIAEGFGRNSNKEYLRFLNVSMASLFELQTQLEISKNIEYLTEQEFNKLYEDSRELERMLVAFINKVRERD